MSQTLVRKITRRRAMFALVAIVLAVRLIWVPLHLAHEAHEYGHGQLMALVHEQHHDHDHDRDHEPHPAADHETELIARKVSDTLGFVLPPIDAAALVAALQRDWCPPLEPADEAPKAPPPRSGRARAPPAA